jgi:hypothetical protein
LPKAGRRLTNRRRGTPPGGRPDSAVGLLARGSWPLPPSRDSLPVALRLGLAAYSCGGSRGFGAKPLPRSLFALSSRDRRIWPLKGWVPPFVNARPCPLANVPAEAIVAGVVGSRVVRDVGRERWAKAPSRGCPASLPQSASTLREGRGKVRTREPGDLPAAKPEPRPRVEGERGNE